MSSISPPARRRPFRGLHGPRDLVTVDSLCLLMDHVAAISRQPHLDSSSQSAKQVVDIQAYERVHGRNLQVPFTVKFRMAGSANVFWTDSLEHGEPHVFDLDFRSEKSVGSTLNLLTHGMGRKYVEYTGRVFDLMCPYTGVGTLEQVLKKHDMKCRSIAEPNPTLALVEELRRLVKTGVGKRNDRFPILGMKLARDLLDPTFLRTFDALDAAYSKFLPCFQCLERDGTMKLRVPGGAELCRSLPLANLLDPKKVKASVTRRVCKAEAGKIAFTFEVVCG